MILKENLNEKITGARDIYNLIVSILATENEVDQKKEHYWVIGTDTKGKVLYVELVTLGILDECTVHPREVFRLAIQKACKWMFLVHNHPSGDPEPSRQDERNHVRMVGVGDLVGIPVRDELIIGAGRYYSFLSTMVEEVDQ